MLFTEFNIDDAKEVWQQEAWEDGHEEGEAKGEAQKSLEIAKNLKRLGIKVEQIVEATGLSIDDIQKL